MFERILVPLDGSLEALRAIGPARRLARLHGARLWLVTVASEDGRHSQAEAILATGRQAAGEATDVAVIPAADVAGALLAFEREHSEALMCLTTRGRTALGHALFGSVAREVVRRSERAQVLVGPACDLDTEVPVRRVIACLDGTPEGELILAHAIGWAESTGVSLLLANVVYPLVPTQAGVAPSEAQLDELGYVRRVARRLEAEGHHVTDVVVQHPHPPDALVDLAERWPDAVLAVASATPSVAGELVTGSVAAEIIRHASVPVLVSPRGR